VKSPVAAEGTIESRELKGALVLVEGQVQVKIEPISLASSLATIRFDGFECVLTEVNQLRGVIYIKDCLGFATTHKLRHLIEAGSSTLLYIGGHSAKQLEITKLLGSTFVELGGAHEGLEWSGMDV
jgi:hypothetical protein